MANITDEVQAKRDFYAGETLRLQKWLSTNKFHPNRKKYIEELNSIYERLREFNAKNKQNGRDENQIFSMVVRTSIGKEVYDRVLSEAKSRMAGNEPKSVSMLTDKDEEKIEKYDALEKKYSALLNKVKDFYRDVDEMMIPTSGSFENSEWVRIVNFNKQVVKIKKEIELLIQ